MYIFPSCAHSSYMHVHDLGRRRIAFLGALHLNLIHRTRPWVAIAWSWFMPGFGHLLLGQYLLGWILFAWEVAVNVETHFNIAILDTFTGHFAAAKQVLTHEQIGFLLFTYGPIFAFAMHHSYLIAKDANLLTDIGQGAAPPLAMSIRQIEWNYLSKKNPVVGWLWSLLAPGVGAIYTHRVLTAFFEIAWWTTIIVKSNILTSIAYLTTGQQQMAVRVLDPEWTLFIPSMFSFAAYYAYVITVERNKLFDREQAVFLTSHYQKNWAFPLHNKGDAKPMRFVASFDHSLQLEVALSKLQQLHLGPESVLAVPLVRRSDGPRADTANHADQRAYFDLASLAAASGCFLGTVYGFVLPLGPVVWGLGGFAIGFAIGLFVKWICNRRKRRTPSLPTEIVVVIECEEDAARQVEQILWSHGAFALARVGLHETPGQDAL
ncbi:hypothetical protein Alches_02000 [Alicyclobacillus hesperidum subsp. aegles]|uniref:hypothetical protein n=1 Tax=Alicyclobacillus hesperidum TaxID=89784 RepID=UPI00222CFE72|nr:hypothetical protein [Alicyclobacillus hesperidum]GLG00161.1 hypothetical protein Alches_02000 [Alicyclobacillus hesperidum subsp. aegles]